MNRMLMIVDPQMDFISGTLPVRDADRIMNALAGYITDSDGRYACKVVTVDWHPYKHCSFIENGGQWPMHCVQHTVGAALYPALLRPLYGTSGEVRIVRKGDKKGTEEYSIFRNAVSARQIERMIQRLDIECIDLCGIAGDVCVLDTLKDGIRAYGPEMFNVLGNFCASIDGGTALHSFLNR